jgi:4-hydroxybenzoate polyprenyltransferase
MKALWQALRPHQWLKNALIFVPLIVAHRVRDFDAVERALLALLEFSFCASAVYIFNDVLDRESDRQHPTKQSRSIASGRLSVPTALGAAAVLLALTFTLMILTANRAAVEVLALYLAITTLYSSWLKKIVILDVVTLAGLYTLRIFFGAATIAVPVSTWLMAFSLFFFTSLAMAKRFSELTRVLSAGSMQIAGRGYREQDKTVVANLGTASGYVSVLVMALYVNSQEVIVLYRQPRLLWLICPMLLYWIGRLWLLAGRGKLDEEPIVFAMKDPASYLVGALSLAVIWISTTGTTVISGS